jgi:hypothetical protein
MLNASGIATGIAALTVAGVTFKDLSSFSDQDYSRDVPAFLPNPGEWLSGSSSSLQTFGRPSDRFWLVERTFNYVYLHEAVGAVRSTSDIMKGMADKTDLIWEALLELDVTDVDVVNVVWSKPVTVTDPSDNQFYGLTCEITVREKVNA